MPYKDKQKQKEKNKEYQKRYYQENRDYYKKRAEDRQLRLRREFDEFKGTLRCESCGEDHIACLDFHHVNPDEKEISISKAVALGWSMTRIKREIEKCKVLCSNCHRKLHHCEVGQR